MQEKLNEIGAEVALLRRVNGIKNATTYRNTKISPQIVKSVERGNKNYTIQTLLKLLEEVGKTIIIVDK